ncbi:MAG: hypothetical protein AB7G06_04290 [Bdellovibrionales bacterium]
MKVSFAGVLAAVAVLVIAPLTAEANTGYDMRRDHYRNVGPVSSAVGVITWPVRKPFERAGYGQWRNRLNLDPSAPEAAPHMDWWWNDRRNTVRMYRETYPPMRIKHISNPNQGKAGTLADWEWGSSRR